MKTFGKQLVGILLAMMAGAAQGAWAQTDVSTASELTEAIANGANIRLTRDITLTAYLQIGNGSSQTVTIDLNGYTLSRNLSAANNNGHVIEVFANGTLTLKGGTLTGGWANNGGGICNYGTLTLNNVIIDKCKATDAGGIKNYEGATLTITGGTISNCRSDAGGGGVVNYGTANISGCTFSGNIATTRGGAIWSNNALTVSGCTFNSNRALAIGGSEQNEGDGGALHINGGTATLTGVTITNNTSKDAGGIYVATGATLNLGGTSTISGNTSSEHGGGGIVNQGTVNLSGDVSITGNTCATNGGGIWNNGTLSMQGNITVKDNGDDDIFLKSGKVIAVSGALTSGANSIGVSMESGYGTLTSGYSISGTTTNPFFSNSSNSVAVVNGECQIQLSNSYINCTWDGTSKTVVQTPTEIPSNATVHDISSYANGGTLTGWVMVSGTRTITSNLTCSRDVHLILCDGAQLTLTQGLTVNNSATLHICSQSYGPAMGKLTVTNSNEAAGIGSEKNYIAGSIEIHGGDVKATGGTCGAGISGGAYIDGGTVIIYGGRVEAHGGTGTGSGWGKSYGGSGIGGGGSTYYESSNNCYGKGGNVTVYGGSVYAYGGQRAAGIGGGGWNAYYKENSNPSGGTLTVHGGYVEARGDEYAAGIGGGQNGNGATVIVNGGKVYAYGGTDAAGIGSGEQQDGTRNGGSLTVNGGYVYAEGNDWGAGIGGGEDADGATVVINGGIVLAKAGSSAGNKNGCAIGSEVGDEHRGTLTIGDGMMVHSGQDASNLSSFTTAERVSACWYRPYARIEPCDHSGSTIAITDGLTHHTSCPYCMVGADGQAEGHVFAQDGKCVCGLYSLKDDADNGEVISALAADQNPHPVTLTGRTLWKDGAWNTLCLPFALGDSNTDDNLTFTGTPLEGATVKTLSSTAFDSKTGTLTLNFSTDLSAIEAGKPYIVKWDKPDTYVAYDGTNATTCSDQVNPVFSGVTIVNTTSDVETNELAFRGIFSPFAISGEDRSLLYLGSDNTLYYPNAAMTIGAFRAYFQLNGITAGAPATGIRSFVLNFGDDTNGITEAEANSSFFTHHSSLSGWFTLDGRRLSGKPTAKGLYLHNGRKVMVK